VLVATWLASGFLAAQSHHRTAVALNVLIATVMCGFALPPLVAFLINAAGYTRRYGAAALHDLPSTAAVAALSLGAIAASLLSLRGHSRSFVLGWLANAPALAFVTYLAFWFRIF
jgi:hypothetical protein